MSSELFVLESELDAFDGSEPEIFYSVKEVKNCLARNKQMIIPGDRLIRFRPDGALPIKYIKSSNTVEIG